MKNIWMWLGIGLVGLLLLAAITPTSSERAKWQIRVVPSSKDSIFQAALTYLQDLGYTIKETSPSAGFIATTHASPHQLQGVWGIIETGLIGERRFSATVLIHPISSVGCQVRVNLIAEEWNSGSSWEGGHWTQDAIYYDKDDYDKFFVGLVAHLHS